MPFNFYGSGGNGGRVNLVFLALNPGVERVWGVIGMNRDSGLGDNGAGVHSCIDIMDGAPALTSSCLYSLGPCVEAGKIGEKRRVNIDDSPGKSIEKRRPEEPHEARETNQFCPGMFENVRGFSLRVLRKLGAEAPAVDQPRG